MPRTPKESAATPAWVSGGIRSCEKRFHHNLTASQRQRAAMVTPDPEAGLLDAMLSAGIRPVDAGAIVADGVLHRFQIDGDKRGTRNGWAVLHHDHGAGGSWKSGATCVWSAKRTDRMTRQEKDLFYRQMRAAKAEAQRQRDAEHAAAAKRASLLWDKAKPATAEHAYLVKKRIRPGNARQQGDLLMLKIEDVSGNIRSLQYIGPNGTKRMLTGGQKRGHFIIVQGALPADLIVVAEGFATASTAATQFPGAAVLAAIDAGNLEPVALAVRAKCPTAQIMIVADDDRLTPGNPGLAKARAAAGAVGGKVARPVWPEGAPESLSDFNDLACWLMEVSA
jgi:putative DNA primase/helicase